MLGGLPLAIAQAFAFMRQNEGLNITNYCDLWEQNQGVGDEDPTTAIIFNTLIIALRDIKLKLPTVDCVLDIIAYLSPDYLTKQLI